ncbi:MAG: Fic family protein [Candidatus Komeilibacteria bacterium]|jgi:Fic family protein|nr:Fic family protein [Candidatus Komeilibacteria bacterium]MBT4447354.1 Fic family protein [Candidatus Komeilibacteria bacterium]
MKKTSLNRAGKYQQVQSKETAYQAFIPSTLPPSPPLIIDDKMQTLLSNADRALGALDMATDLLPDSDFFILSYLRKEATLSSQIEGTQATFMDVAKAEAGATDDEIPKDYEEIINYTDALNFGLKKIRQDDFPLTLRLIKDIHNKLMVGVRGQHKTPGEFRTSQNWIGGATINTASYIPPTVDNMQASLTNLEKFLHDTNPLPPLIKIALIHTQFENIHPFLDGNGRIGRLLITLLLCHYRLLNKPALYLSEYFKVFQKEYYNRLDNVHEKGDYESWCKFFLEGVWVVAEQAVITAKKINSLKEKDMKRLSELSAQSSKNAILLLEELFGNPIITVNDASRMTGITFANANNLVEKMVDLKILTPLNIKLRDRVFVYTKYIDLFKERDYKNLYKLKNLK